MARKLNKNLVVILTFLGLLITTVGGVLMVYRLRQTDPKYFVSRGDQSEAEGNFIQAGKYFLQAYRISRDPTYLVRVGDAFRDAADDRRAAAAWSQAIGEDPKLLSAHERLLDYQLGSTRFGGGGAVLWSVVLETAKAFAEQYPENPKALYGKGLALIRLKEQNREYEQQGIETLTRAVEIAPEVAEYTVALARVHDEKGDNEKAEALFQDLLAKNAEPGRNSVDARIEYSRFLVSHDRIDDALVQLATAREMADDDPDIVGDAELELGNLWNNRWIAAKRANLPAEQTTEIYDKAVQHYKASIEASTGNFDAVYNLSLLYLRNSLPTESVKVLEARLQSPVAHRGAHGRQQMGKRHQLLLALIDSLIARIELEKPDKEQREAMLTDADRLMKEAEAEFPDIPQTYHYKGRLAMMRDKDLEAIGWFEKAEKASLRLYPANNRLLAQLLFRTNPGAAREKMQELLQSEPSADGFGFLGQILLQIDKPEDARRAANTALQIDPNDRRALSVLLEASYRLGDTEKVKELDRALGQGTTADKLRNARILLNDENERPQAISTLESILETEPGNVEAARLLIASYVQDKAFDKAQALAEKGSVANPDDLAWKALKLVADPNLSEQDRKDSLRQIFEQISDPLDRAQSLFSLYANEGKNDEATKYLDEVTQLVDPKEKPDLYRDIVRQQHRLGILTQNFERAEKWIKIAKELDLDGVGGQIMQAQLFLAQKKHQEAAASCRDALAKQPNNSIIHTLLGEALMGSGQFLEAEAWFKKAVQANPNNSGAHLRLAQLAYKSDKKDDLTRELAECRRLIPNDAWVRERLLEQAELQDPKTGIVRREEIRTANPNDLQNLIKLGALYEQAGDPVKAEEVIRDAASQSNNDLAVMAHLADFLVRQGRATESLEMLGKLVQDAKTPVQQSLAQMMIGALLETTGQRDAAEAAYLAAAGFNESVEVCDQLARFYGTDITALEKAVPWFDKAVSKAVANDSALEQPIRSRYCLALLRANAQKQAAEQIAAYIERFPNDPQARLLDSDLNIREGRIADALAILNRAIELNPRSAESYYARGRLQRSQGRLVGAIEDLEKLRSLAPDAANLAPWVLLARCYEETGQLSKGFAELEELWRKSDTAFGVARELLNMYGRHEKYLEQESVLLPLINRFPENPEWRLLQGQVGIDLNDAKRALPNLMRAAELSNYQDPAMEHLVRGFIKFGAASQGIQYIDKSIPADRQDAVVTQHRATLLAVQGDIDNATAQYVAAMQKAGDDYLQVFRIAQTAARGPVGLERIGKEVRALASSENANFAIRYTLAAFLANQNQHDEAGRLFESLLDASPDPVRRIKLMTNLGEAAEKRDDPAGARRWYEEALKVNPDAPVVLNNLAYVLGEKLHEPKLALPYAQRAAILMPDEPAVLDTLAWTYAQLGRYPDAIGELTRALQQNPEFVPAMYHLAEAHRQNGDPQEASRLCEQALKFLEERHSNEFRTELEQLQQDLEKSE